MVALSKTAFELCRTPYLDRPWSPVRKGGVDLSSWAFTLFHISTNFVSSSGIHMTLDRGRDGEVETLEQGALGAVVGVVGTHSNLNLRLYIISVPIRVHMKKPWKGHS